MKPKLNTVAPDFTAPVVGGKYTTATSLTLSELKGSQVALIFYPKDDTPGCTTQACEIRDNWEDIPNVKVFGVSIDPIESHEKFITKYTLPYPLIADEDKAIVTAYGVWVEKSMYGKKYMGTERSTFIIDEEGNLKAVLERVQPKKHLEALKEALKK